MGQPSNYKLLTQEYDRGTCIGGGSSGNLLVSDSSETETVTVVVIETVAPRLPKYSPAALAVTD